MEFSVTKCKVMHLGIMISSDVKSSQQCVVACNKANMVFGMIFFSYACHLP